MTRRPACICDWYDWVSCEVVGADCAMLPDGGNPQYPPTFTGAQARAQGPQGADAVGGGSNSTRGTAPASRIRIEPGSGDA